MIDHSYFDMGPEEYGVHIPVAAVETFVNGVYASMDKATAGGLARLLSEDGITPSCKLGCAYCCRFYILLNIAEAHTLAKFIRREFSADQIDALRVRTQQWHEWENARPGKYPQARAEGQTDLSGYEHGCPMLIDGACSAYAVRPVVCRTHYVSSPPLACDALNHPEITEDAPDVLRSIVKASGPFSAALRDHIEDRGVDFSRSLMLLPHWLAIAMGWDFAISP